MLVAQIIELMLLFFLLNKEILLREKIEYKRGRGTEAKAAATPHKRNKTKNTKKKTSVTRCKSVNLS
jgi:hypothetical protein